MLESVIFLILLDSWKKLCSFFFSLQTILLGANGTQVESWSFDVSLTEDDVKKIAVLSNLNVAPNELSPFTAELSSILGYVQQLEKVDVASIEATSHAHGATNFFREDVVQEPLAPEEGLKNAPDRSGRFIRVPIIIDQNTES